MLQPGHALQRFTLGDITLPYRHGFSAAVLGGVPPLTAQAIAATLHCMSGCAVSAGITPMPNTPAHRLAALELRTFPSAHSRRTRTCSDALPELHSHPRSSCSVERGPEGAVLDPLRFPAPEQPTSERELRRTGSLS